MKNILPSIIIGIFFLAAVGWAVWQGTVVWSDDGNVGRGAEVIAWGANCRDVYDYTGSQGEYWLSEAEGMKIDSTYKEVTAEKEREGETWKGLIDGGVYTSTPRDEDITLYSPEEYPWK